MIYHREEPLINHLERREKLEIIAIIAVVLVALFAGGILCVTYLELLS